MKVTIVTLVWGSLLLNHHASSVDAFRQSSTGQFNTLTGRFPKSMPMHGYLNSLGKTAAAFTPRYEADYPRRHTAPSEPVASNGQQSDPVAQHSSNKAPSGTGFGTGTGGWYRQSTSSTELSGDPYFATNVVQPEIIKPTDIPSTEKQVEAVPKVSWEKPVTKSKSFTGYLDSFAKMWSTVDISMPAAAEMATTEEDAYDVPAESEIVEEYDVPAESELVEDDDLPSWVKAFMNKDDASMDKDVYAEKTASRHEPVTENPNTNTGDTKVAKNVWRTSSPIMLHGNSLRTWSEPSVERVQLSMKTAGRAMFANVELWHGPDTTPLKITIHSDDGSLHPFNAVIETPAGPNTIAVRNTGQMEFPMAACVETDGVENVAKRLSDMGTLKTIQGGASLEYPFDRSVASVQILLMTAGRPLNTRIELSQGPNNDKQAIDIYSEDGLLRPFFAVIETPGTDNVVRVVNTATPEFSMTACVQPYLIESGSDESSNHGWDNGGIRDPRWGGRH